MIIPKKMDNKESILVADIVCIERELAKVLAKYEAFKAKRKLAS